MIVSFRHKGLRQLYESDDRRRIAAEQVERIRRILARLDVASSPDDLNLPGYRLHRLRGDLVGHWAVNVSGNWRIVFRFEGGHAHDVDLVDYH